MLVATLATMRSCSPRLMTPGLGGFLFKPLALAGFAIMPRISWHGRPSCAKLLKGHPGPATDPESPALRQSPSDPGGELAVSLAPLRATARLSHGFQAGLARLIRRYEAALRAAMDHRGLVLGGTAALLAASFLLVPVIGQEFFPQVDAGQISMTVRCPSHLRLDATEERIARLEEFIEQQIPADERKMIVSEMGLNPDWSSAYTVNAGQQDTIIRIQLTEERTLTAQGAIKLRHAIAADDRFADMEVAFDTGGMVSAALNYGVRLRPSTSRSTAARRRSRRTRPDWSKRAPPFAGPPTSASSAERRPVPRHQGESDRSRPRRPVGPRRRDAGCHDHELVIALTRNFWIDPKSGNQYFVAVQYPEDPNFKAGRPEERVRHRHPAVAAG